MTTNDSIYAPPKAIEDPNDCYFYHTMDIPNHGTVHGQWDLRKGARKYLGGVDLKGKRVLEIGTASGSLCFYMESQGAEVVAYDLDENQSWDIVPYYGVDHSDAIANRKAVIRKLNNGFWLAHKAFKSNAKVVYGTAYDVPEEIGMVDVATFGAVLTHLQNPFRALESALRRTEETVIVTECLPLLSYYSFLPLPGFLHKLTKPAIKFLPDFSKGQPLDTWWTLSPEIVKSFIGVFGFGRAEVKYHLQKYNNRPVLMYTVVGHSAT